MASISTCFTISPKSHSLFTTTKPSLYLHRLRPFGDSCSVSFTRFQPQNFKLSRCSRVFATAKLNIDGLARPGGVIESDRLPSDVRNRTMDAIKESGGRVTIGDVASRAGLKVNEAQTALQALAADTDGFLEVSDEGDVLYVFPKDYRMKLTAKSFRMKFEPLVEKTKAAAEYVVRVSFGTALIASIVIVFTAIIAILSSKSDEDDRGRRRSRSYGSGFTTFISPTDLFWYWDPNYYRRRRARTNDDDDKMNFIDSVFSFVFGDGDPNQGIEEKRWKLIGQYISSNGGVVTAQELAPYLDLESSNGNMNDESYILPVLLRFDGEPIVDEEGNILYKFPSLQRTALSQNSRRKEYMGRRWADWAGGVEKFFKEKKWEFSKTDGSERAMAIGLGGLNLFGIIILKTMLNDVAVIPPGFLQFVSSIFPLLQIYAGSFFAIPLIRWFLILRKNAEIEKRNKAREQAAQALELPDLSLRRKLLSARDMAQKTVIGQDRIIYSTDKDLYEQDYEIKEWDRRFGEIEKSE